MTREENLLYRRSCPYDAMGDYSSLIGEEKKKNRTIDAASSEAIEKGIDPAVPVIK